MSESVSVLVALGAKCYEILKRIVAQLVSWLNVMFLHAPTRLASPAIALEDFPAELGIGFMFKPQAGSLGMDPFQNTTL
jgi:hypothetical protein